MSRFEHGSDGHALLVTDGLGHVLFVSDGHGYNLLPMPNTKYEQKKKSGHV